MILMARQKSSKTIQMEASVSEFVKSSEKGTTFNIKQILYGYMEAAQIPETEDKEYYTTMNITLNNLVKQGKLNKIEGTRGRGGIPSKFVVI